MDFFIATGTNSGVRKKENLHALYSMLEYCEEPFLCRRFMQLQFLGEHFSSDLCMRMCDNCRRGLQICPKDMSREAIILTECIQTVSQNRGKITTPQIVDLLRGKKVQGVWLKNVPTDGFFGKLKTMQESEIRRIIIKML